MGGRDRLKLQDQGRCEGGCEGGGHGWSDEGDGEMQGGEIVIAGPCCLLICVRIVE